MSKELRHEEKVEITLERPYQTNGQWMQGTVNVSPDVAEDLQRRQAEWKKYDDSRHRDNGRPIDVGSLVGGDA